MNANSKPKMVISGFLGTVILFTALLLGTQQKAQGYSILPPGFGERSGFENHSSPVEIRSVSMGDLRQYEKEQEQLGSPAVYTGFGDLRQYENQLAALSEALAVPAGMGDLHRFESGR